MVARIRTLLRWLPAGVTVSLAAHAVLVTALFVVPGVARLAAERVLDVRANLAEDRAERFDPPPPPAEFRPLETEETRIEPRIEETPPEESPVFPTDEPVDPFVTSVPSDLPRSAGRKVIGVGGGAPGGEPAPAAPPPMRKAPPPPPPPRKAVPENTPPPEYPPRAVDRQIEGRVLLLVEVLPDGSVGTVTVKESSGHAILDRAAEAAVRGWHFQPARVQGQPIRSLVEIPISFRLTG